MFCEKCGAEMVSEWKPPSLNWSCPNCNWGVSATHFAPHQTDPVMYRMFAVLDASTTKRQWLLYASVKGCSVREAWETEKNVKKAASPLAVEICCGLASEIMARRTKL